MIEPADFTRVRWREGYAPEEVDAFIDRLVATVDGRPISKPVTPDEIRNVTFRTVRLRWGYAVPEVDEFLDIAAGWLTKR